MDLLAGYDSDGSGGSDGSSPPPSPGNKAAAPKPPGGLLQILPKSSTSHEASQSRLSAPARPQHHQQADPLDLPSSSGNGAALFSKLPEPALPTKRVVNFQVPLKRELLAKAAAQAGGADSDDEDEPKVKRFKSSGKKMELLASLPAPKHDAFRLPPTRALGVGLPGAGSLSAAADEEGGSGAGAGAGARPSGSGAHAGSGGAGAPPPDFFDASAGNEAYRVQEDAAQQPGASSGADQQYYDPQYAQYYNNPAYAQYYNDPQYASYYQQYYAQQQGEQQGPAAMPVGYGKQKHQQGSSGGEDLIAEALRAEEEKLAKRGGKGGGGGLRVVEITQGDLTKQSVTAREATTSLADTLGAEYANKLRAEAAAAAGNKLARRKHQIGTLLSNAKLRELELLDKNATSAKTKKETQAKYGWS